MNPLAAPARGLEHAVILFDGVCNLCNAWVDFVVRHDRRVRFRFAPLQSRLARELLAARRSTDEVRESIVLVEPDGRLFYASGAVLRIVKGLGLPWILLYPLIVVPRPVRDFVYDRIARRRYRWFGRRDTCRLPTPEERARFLDTGPSPPDAI